MVFLTALLAGLFALAPEAQAQEGFQPWVALPTEGPAALASRADAALRGIDLADLLRKELPVATKELFAKSPHCRRTPACRNLHVPEGANLMVDLRIETHSSTVARLEIQLHEMGDPSTRIALFVANSALESTIRSEVVRLLQPHSPSTRLARLSAGGNGEASGTLRQQYPESPYLPAGDPKP